MKSVLFLSDFYETSIPRRIFFNAQIPNFKKFLSVGAELLRAKGQADVTRLLAAFHDFSNAPGKVIIIK